ncbi:MAG: GGDEF domain-containing protein [Planctomycetota bacterium]
MSDRAATFVCGASYLAEELGRYVGAERELAARAEAYAALEELARRKWSAVVIAADTDRGVENGELAGLCRAVRRLQRDTRVVVLCRPADEPTARELAGTVVDDYFISPSAPSDWKRIAVVVEAPGPPGRAAPAAMPAEEIAALIDAARTVASLEAHVAGEVRRRLGVAAEWVNADAVDDVRRAVLLTTTGTTPRSLVVDDASTSGDEAEVYLASLRTLLPALAAAAERTESLHRLAVTDHLTGAYNRRYFYHATDRILQRDDADKLRVTLLLYDIDDFKRYNDVYGHAAGDEILRETAALMRGITRSQDITARIGGDEFAVLFWEPGPPRKPGSHPPEDAHALADRFRRGVEQLEFRALGPEARGVLSISGGLARFPEDGRTCRELLAAADRALDEAKQQGKNAIRLVGG